MGSSPFCPFGARPPHFKTEVLVFRNRILGIAPHPFKLFSVHEKRVNQASSHSRWEDHLGVDAWGRGHRGPSEAAPHTSKEHERQAGAQGQGGAWRANGFTDEKNAALESREAGVQGTG